MVTVTCKSAKKKADEANTAICLADSLTLLKEFKVIM
jgi:hypothetical protein